MAKPTGFLEYARQNPTQRPIPERIHDFSEINKGLDPDQLEIQAARCMDCGVPTCHAYGCPLGNLIPDFNDLVYKKKWRAALELLHKTNNLPEITGRICPAPCEAACTLYINQEPVTIRQIELQIVERGWEQGWIRPQPATFKTGKKVAIVGSGPAGLAAAQQLARQGHKVTLYEKSDRIGGILRYGIPDYKLAKGVIDRRLEQMLAEGVIFQPHVEVGKDIPAAELAKEFDAILITTGASVPRDLKVPGRELPGTYFAMDFITQQNKVNAGDEIPPSERISARDKHVVVVGGGDTGSDCIGTSIRQGARHVTQIELLPKPLEGNNPDTPWPMWPVILRTSTSHQEGCDRLWSIATKQLTGVGGQVKALQAVKLDWTRSDDGCWTFKEIPGSKFALKADLVLLAMGFMHAGHGSLVEDLKLEKDQRGNIKVNENFMTSTPGVFAAGDAETGASLAVRAIHRGRLAAGQIDAFLSEVR